MITSFGQSLITSFDQGRFFGQIGQTTFRRLVVHLLLPGAQVELALGDGEGEEGGQGEDDQPGGDRVSHIYSVLFNQM